MKYRVKESFYNPLTGQQSEKGDLIETEKANTFKRFCEEVNESKVDIKKDETVKEENIKEFELSTGKRTTRKKKV